FRRHHRAASGPVDRRVGSPGAAAGLGVVRRRLSGGMRSAGAHAHCAGGDSGRRGDRAPRWSVFSMALGTTIMTGLWTPVSGLWQKRPARKTLLAIALTVGLVHGIVVAQA